MSYTCECGRRFDVAATLDATAADGIGSSARFSPPCLGCGRPIEIELRTGEFVVGLSYAAGALHVEPLQRVAVRGLTIRPRDPDDLEVTLGERRWRFGVRRTSQARFVVLPNAFAAGRSFGDLDFEQWSVTVVAIERNGERLTPDPAWTLAAGDAVHLAGAQPALTRAWHFLNDGRSRRVSEAERDPIGSE